VVTGGGPGIGAAVRWNPQVAWLCLPSSESITGQAIAVAGGEVM
jgi:hypothetical protein